MAASDWKSTDAQNYETLWLQAIIGLIGLVGYNNGFKIQMNSDITGFDIFLILFYLINVT